MRCARTTMWRRRDRNRLMRRRGRTAWIALVRAVMPLPRTQSRALRVEARWPQRLHAEGCAAMRRAAHATREMRRSEDRRQLHSSQHSITNGARAVEAIDDRLVVCCDDERSVRALCDVAQQRCNLVLECGIKISGGSSARMSCAPVTSARAIATRCRSPCESCEGRRADFAWSPTAPTNVCARSLASL